MRAWIAAASLLLLLTPASALATGQVSVDPDGWVEFLAASGEANNLAVSATIDASGQVSLVFTDHGAPLDESAAGCELDGTNVVTCAGPYGGWRAKLGDMGDTASASGNLEGAIEGGEANDVINGSETNELQELLSGGEGNDQLRGGGGEDFLVGEGGADFVDGGPGTDRIGDAGGDGNDSLDGGIGFDVVAYTGTTLPPAPLETFGVDLFDGRGGRTGAAPEIDTLAGIEDVDTAGLFAPSGDDTIVGSLGSNVIGTGAGNDAINPAAGADSVLAGSGNDSVDVVDGSSDRVACAEGVDIVQADQFDELAECESVSLATVPAASADADPPGCVVSDVKRRLRRRAFFRGVRPDVDCDEAASVLLRLVVNVKGGSLLARVGDLVLAQRSTVAGTNVKLKPARRFARRLTRTRGFRARLVVEATDAARNRSVVTRRISVRKAGKKRARR